MSSVRVDIEAKPLDVLSQLLQHAGEVLSKEELLDAVWPGTAVVDASLTTAVSKLRKALGRDDLIATIPRVGYRLAVPAARVRSARPSWPALRLVPGDPVPGRESWRLVRSLDRSPSSEVWLSEHPKTHEWRVFKFASDETRLAGFKREITLSRLLRTSLGDRPDFVRILEWNLDTAPYFLEIEYAGANLVEWAEAQGGLLAVPIARRLRLLVDIATAVADAHELGILHKDLKPTNILVSTDADGRPHVKVADFGSASLSDPSRLDSLGITSLGFTQPLPEGAGVAGTALYLAPEVLAGQSPTTSSDVYALGLLLYQLVAGDFRKPLAPGWEADVAAPFVRECIASAASGDPHRRLSSARALAEWLVAGEMRQGESAPAVDDGSRFMPSRRSWIAAAGLAAVLLAMVGLVFYGTARATARTVRSVAVLPFENVEHDEALDFLRLALPDEIATLLTDAGGISVRPSVMSRGVGASAADVQKVGRDMGVGTLVTGHFLRAGAQLQVTFEAVDVATARLLSRHTVHAPAGNLLAAQAQIALQVKGGLLPAFGVSAVGGTRAPRSEAAYDLFLRSAALAFDPDSNRQGIGMLERAVALDPAYPPAWVALARRYYSDARFGSGDPRMMDRYEAAARQLLALDPASLSGTGGLVTVRVERGDLAGAYELADHLVRRWPASAESHHPYAVVLRYAGLIQEAGEHCDKAFLIDPRMQISGLRSCAIPFLLQGEYAHASAYLELDLDSAFAKALSIEMLVAQGRLDDARRLGSPGIAQWKSFDLLLACAAGAPAAEIERLAGAVVLSDDPEINYFSAGHLAYCGRTDAALDMLSASVKGGYCSYPAMDTDPFFARVWTTPRFAGIRRDARACQRAFVAQRGRPRQ